MRLLLLLLLLSISLMSCGYNPKLTKEDLTFPKSAKLDFAIIPTDFSFIRPFQIVVHDSLLIVQDNLSRDISFHIFCAKAGNFVKSFGNIGRAGGELVTPSRLYEESRGVYATSDLNSKKIVSYNVDSVLVGSSDYFSEFKFDDVPKYRSFDLLGDKPIVTGYSDCRFGMLDKLTGTVKTLYSTYPDVVEHKEAWVLSQLFGYGNLITALSPDDKKMVSMTYLGAVAETFDVGVDSLTLRAERCFEYPDIKVAKTWIEPSKENTMRGFDNVIATDKNIYAVYNGDVADAEKSSCDIYVFDWDLNPVIKYTLDVKYIYGYDYNRESGEVYAVVSIDEDIKIIRINEKFIQ